MTAPLPEPQRQAGSGAKETPHASLWQTAPAWRNLIIGAASLTACAVVTPFWLHQTGDAVAAGAATAAEAPQNCPLQPGQPGGSGKVVGFLTAGQAQDMMQRTQAQLQAKISPAYVSNLRAAITPDGVRRLVALVPAGMTVKIGDQVEFIGAYKDPTLPCHYVPNLISKLISAPNADGAGEQKQ